ncbi:Phospholipase D p1, partial [Zancudomyces culisetae]
GSPESFHTSSDSSVDKSSSESPVDGAVGSKEGSGTPEINLADVEDYDRPKRDIFLNAGVEFNPTTPRSNSSMLEGVLPKSKSPRGWYKKKRSRTASGNYFFLVNSILNGEKGTEKAPLALSKSRFQRLRDMPLHRRGFSLQEKVPDVTQLLDNISVDKKPPSSVVSLVAEQVYVHAKMMIVDDKIAVIGSANINDRSMAGNRDSEIAVVIEDGDCVDSFMDSQPYQATRFAHGLRMKLCHEHLGLAFDEESFYQNPNFFSHSKAVMDPLSNEFLELWDGSARKNHEIFKNVFKCTPDDSVRTFADYKKFVHPAHLKIPYGHSALQLIETDKELLEGLAPVSGHLVPFPLDFLAGESLEPKINQPDYYLPIDVYI